MVTKKDGEILSEAIRNGINKASEDFWSDILKGLLLGAGIIVIGVLLFSIYNNYHEVRYPQISGSIQQVDKCNYPYITCKIYEENRYWACDGKVYPVSLYIETEPASNITGINISKSNEACVDVSGEAPLKISELCGYQEANAWFENFKSNHKSLYKLKMECN